VLLIRDECSTESVQKLVALATDATRRTDSAIATRSRRLTRVKSLGANPVQLERVHTKYLRRWDGPVVTAKTSYAFGT